MKFCQKCRNFYDDANLAFCQKDGVPLVRLDQSSNLWSEGTEAIKSNREIAVKQFRIQTLKNYAKIAVTTIITTMVIYQLWHNIEFPSATNNDEKAKNNSLSPSVTPTKEKLPIIKETTRRNTNIATSPSQTADSDNNKSCSDEDRNEKIPNLIRRENYKELQSALQADEQDFKDKFEVTNGYDFDRIKIKLNFKEDDITSVIPSNNCQQADVTVKFSWSVADDKNINKVKDERGESVFRCDKNRETWNCTKK